MVAEEAIAILKILRVAYPKFYSGMSSDDATDIIDLWATMFADDNATVVTEAVKIIICTSKFPPSIAEVKEKINLIKNANCNDMSELEAWAKVKKAINYYNAGETFSQLDSTIQKIIGSANQLKEWSCIDKDTLNSVIQSNFCRSYTYEINRQKEFNALPDSTKKIILQISNRLSLKIN